MTPPPPPPPSPGHVGPAPPLLSSTLQVMMREMQYRQPKLQQQMLTNQGGRGGRHGGRGRGRKGFHHPNYRRYHGDNRVQSRCKRGPSDEVRDTSRFFLPSFLEDPWKALETSNGTDREQEGDPQRREEMCPRQVQHHSAHGGLGRVLFQPSFLDDPWVR